MATYGKRKASARSSNSCGEFPESGAIFMSSSATKEECLKKKLFGLPIASADFVKAIRSGMTLFLFQYEGRKLYGVFEAVSDGQLNIVPHAFQSSSHKPFPAQVRIRVTWDCHPIPEDIFRDAIIDNYFEKHKFNFGLSEQQVHRLLQLFDAQRMRVEKPLLKKEARKRYFRSPSDGRNLVMTPGEPGIAASYHTTGRRDESYTEKASDEIICFSRNKQVSTLEQVKHAGVSPAYALALGDYIPLFSPNCCNIEVNVKAVYSFPQTAATLKSTSPAYQENEDTPGTSGGFQRKIADSDLVPKFVHQKNIAYEGDHPVYRNSEDLRRGHDRMSYKRPSVFSRLTFT